MSENKKNYLIIVLVFVIILETTLFFINNDKKDEKNNDIKDNTILETNNDIKDNTSLETNNDKNEDTNIETNVEEISIDNETVKKLYNFTAESFMWYFDDEKSSESLYRKNKVTLANLSDGEKIEALFGRDTLLEKDYDDIKYNYLDDNSNVKISEEKYYSKDKILSAGKKLFGDKFSLNFIEGKRYASCICEDFSFKNGSIVVFNMSPNCGGGIVHFSKRKMIRAEKTDNYIFIYDKYFFINDNGSEKHPTGIYDTYEMKNLLKKFSEKEHAIDVKFEDYEDLANTFKHTFKKDADGNYYWVSSEMMK